MNAHSYKVMQYNVLHDGDGWGWENLPVPKTPASERKKQVMQIIEAYSPDVLLLCERHPEWQVLNELLDEKYAVIGDRLSYEKGEYSNYCGERLSYPAYEEDTGNRTPIYYNKQKLELVKSGMAPIEILTELGKADMSSAMKRSQNKRVVTWGILRDRSNGVQIAVFGTHWTSHPVPSQCGIAYAAPAGNDMDLWRKWQSDLLAEIMSQVLTDEFSAIPVIVMADFNALSTAGSYCRLLEQAGLTDALPEETGLVDHIAVKRFQIVGSGKDTSAASEVASDHKPIWCELVVEK